MNYPAKYRQKFYKKLCKATKSKSWSLLLCRFESEIIWCVSFIEIPLDIKMLPSLDFFLGIFLYTACLTKWEHFIRKSSRFYLP